MRRSTRGLAAAASLVAGLAAWSPGDGAAADPGYGSRNEHGLFLNILPAGQGHAINALQGAQFLALGQYPPNWLDQLDMYKKLPLSPGAVTDRNLTEFFKP